MEWSADKTTYAVVEPMREAYRAEAACQIVHDSALRRGIADPYLLKIDGETVGYGGVWNRYYEGRVMEFHLDRGSRRYAVPLLEALVSGSKAVHIEAQTNMPLILCMAHDFADTLAVEAILFADTEDMRLDAPNLGSLTFREVENVEPNHPDSRDYALELEGQPVVTGGYLCHYNPPYADVHLEVDERFRKQGLGSYFVQQVKRVAYVNGKIPVCRSMQAG